MLVAVLTSFVRKTGSGQVTKLLPLFVKSRRKAEKAEKILKVNNVVVDQALSFVSHITKHVHVTIVTLCNILWTLLPVTSR